MKNDDLKLEGAFHKTAHGRLSYEVDRATPEFILVVAKILHSRFGFSKSKMPIVGLEAVITDCERNRIKLLLGWDIWCGFYVFADSEDGDAVVSEVGIYLGSIIQNPEFEKYIHRS